MEKNWTPKYDFSTIKCRGKLVVSKIWALLLGAGVIVILFYGTGFIESSLLYSGDFLSNMAYPIQSVHKNLAKSYGILQHCRM